MNGQRAGADHPTFGEIYDGDLSDAEMDVLRYEDPCRFLATDQDEEARIRGLESLPAITLWRKAEHALAEYLGLHVRDGTGDRKDLLGLLDERADELRRQADTKSALAHVKQVQNESELRALLQEEVERDQPRKPVIGAINMRQDELRQAAATDGGEAQ